MNILITGGAGFIGSHICDQLVQRGHTLVIADNLVLGSLDNINHLTNRRDVSFVEMDVSDRPVLEALFDKHDFHCVFHMAANSDIARSHADPDVDFTNTLATTYSVLEAMRKHQVKRIVFASTSAIYGEAPGKIREDHGPLFPISHYGAAKLASEAFISSFCENYGIQAWITRFPNVVGDRSTHGAIYDFANKLHKTPERLEVLGDGSQVKPYVHVSDLVAAILFTWDNSNDQMNFFNIGGDTRASVRRMAEITVEESPNPSAEIVYTGGDRGWVGDVPKVEYDTSKIKALGWTPQLDSESAVRAAAKSMFERLK